MPKEIMDIIIGSGPLGVLFVYLFWDTRKENKEREEAYIQIIKDNRERELQHIEIINNLSTKLDVIKEINDDVEDIKSDIKDIKNNTQK
ncbi:bacteriocin [Clostridium sardiniense]|uniref:Bacteriocin n=1 Tax=Clostridium sardiniense TaxID=29369 RepID=A0ABS7KW16_CLOSR|nr:BhlA/UviB family holin-like peptide [Clostridium sardiniense]MBY0755011.1 bacteriocin [Clostridium sardiniense]MDQ0459135.1 hypothetical protein [Clostridium sardiniense]